MTFTSDNPVFVPPRRRPLKTGRRNKTMKRFLGAHRTLMQLWFAPKFLRGGDVGRRARLCPAEYASRAAVRDLSRQSGRRRCAPLRDITTASPTPCRNCRYFDRSGVSEGAELYDIACPDATGPRPGLFAISLVGIGVPETSIRSFVTRGIPRSGMPTFAGQFTESQLDALVAFVAGLASGEIAPLPESYSLPPAQFKCSPASASAKCGVK